MNGERHTLTGPTSYVYNYFQHCRKGTYVVLDVRCEQSQLVCFTHETIFSVGPDDFLSIVDPSRHFSECADVYHMIFLRSTLRGDMAYVRTSRESVKSGREFQYVGDISHSGSKFSAAASIPICVHRLFPDLLAMTDSFRSNFYLDLRNVDLRWS